MSNSSEITNEPIMEATYNALCEYGYANTSISKIAAELDQTKASIYYHYENKDDLSENFLWYLLELVEKDLQDLPERDPKDHIMEVVRQFLPENVDETHLQLLQALLQMRAQVPYNDMYQDPFEHSDDIFRSELTEGIERGIERGDFRSVDPHDEADFIYTMIYGAAVRAATASDPDVARRGRVGIEQYIESKLIAEE